jgi:glycosyltransferase A (GT-A) superfamily protein (DUF2064 family)
MTVQAGRILITAKAPIPGFAKTRLAASIGPDRAADVAAAALLDTLQAAAAVPAAGRFVALTGDLSQAARGAQIRAALDGWTVFEQCGSSFGQRLAHAHGVVAEAGPGPVIQIGMDTPQVTSANLQAVADSLAAGAPIVLGAADDGGWWVLGLADGNRAAALVDVKMSTPTTHADTAHALTRDGTAWLPTEVLRDVDTLEDAEVVAALIPESRFARAWADCLAVSG